MSKTIYLANPYGFSAQQKAELLPPLVVCAGGAWAGGVGAVRAEQPGGLRGGGVGVSASGRPISATWRSRTPSSPSSTAFRPTRG